MPCGGGDIGLNVWVEHGDILFYIARSGTFDENNALLKPGRVRLSFSPNPFAGKTFKQELVLEKGLIKITAGNGALRTVVKIWVDVYRPVIHVETKSNRAISTVAQYESWRYQDQVVTGKANNANSYKVAPQGMVTTFRDNISMQKDQVVFYHRNNDLPSVFDITVHQQGMDSVKAQMFNPLRHLAFGGVMEGTGMVANGTDSGRYRDTDFRAYRLRSKKPSTTNRLSIYLHTNEAKTPADWQTGLQQEMATAKTTEKTAFTITAYWWKQYWNRSFIYINPFSPDDSAGAWQAGRNYQLMRYLLGCNAFGTYPTKFNGRLFTYDPYFVDSTYPFTPDFNSS